MILGKENQIIQSLAKQILKTIGTSFGEVLKKQTKLYETDVVSELDLLMDRLIVSSLRKHFPADKIISEESSGGLKLDRGRTWIVDPLCGSVNVAQGVKFFCSNIALVIDGKVRGAWVVDHSRDRLIWSTGQNKVFIGNKKIESLKNRQKIFSLVDVDYGYFYPMGRMIMEKYLAMARELIFAQDIEYITLNSSLGFTYVAAGQIAAAITININSWDHIAASFLTTQNRGIVTNYDGSPWTINSRSLIYAANKRTHNWLLRLVRKHHLTKIK